MLKTNPGIFALCEPNLHDDIHDSDFQLLGYLQIHRMDAGHMHGLGVYVKSNLPISRETILEVENDCCFRFALLHCYLYIFLVSFAIFVILFCARGCVIQYSQGTSMPITPCGFAIPLPLMLQVCFVKSFL